MTSAGEPTDDPGRRLSALEAGLLARAREVSARVRDRVLRALREEVPDASPEGVAHGPRGGVPLAAEPA